MSRDVIKRAEFRELYSRMPPEGSTEAAMADASPLLPGQPAPPVRYTSERLRLRELVERLQEADEREARNVSSAREEARKEALAEARAEYAEAIETFRTIAAHLRGAIDREIELATSELIEVATAIASKIVRHEIRTDDEYVVRLVRRCLAKILQPSAVRVRLHPDDHDRVAATAGALSTDTDARHQLAFEADRRVERGGCIVEIPDFIVDARRDTQLAAAKASMGGAG